MKIITCQFGYELKKITKNIERQKILHYFKIFYIIIIIIIIIIS